MNKMFLVLIFVIPFYAKGMERQYNNSEKEIVRQLVKTPGGFAQRCAEVSMEAQAKQAAIEERRRKENEDIDGLIAHTLADRGYIIRPKYYNDSYARLMYESITLYENFEGTVKYIDFSGIYRMYLLRDLIKDQLNRSESLAELLFSTCDLNNRGKKQFTGPNVDLLAIILENCVINKDQEGNNVVDTSNLLKNTGLINHFYAALGYTSLGIGLTVAGYYLAKLIQK